MEREQLIKKWLQGYLSPKELEAFDALEDANELRRLEQAMPFFKAETLNKEQLWQSIQQKKDNKQQPKVISLLKKIAPIAAILVFALGIIFSFKYLNTPPLTSQSTAVAEQKIITLPDASKVQLNAASVITYNKEDWNTNRALSLKGEAYFKVAKGKKFTVTTTLGKVTVLGTQFNVKQRDNYFEVHCYEGSVKVTSLQQSIILAPGERVRLKDQSLVKIADVEVTSPSWTTGSSSFISVPYSEVIKELERQYNVTIEHQLETEDQLFTGKFPHNSLKKALQTITLPLHYTFKISKNTVTLYGE